MDLASVADELYGLVPADFTAARNARAKAVGAEDKALADQIRRLPKPSAAAWAVNMLVRRRPDDITGILEVGVSLREAQEALDPGEMKALGRQRQVLIAAVARLARDLAGELGNPISEPAVAEVEQTLQAAMADPGAALAVRTGRLVRALASTGLEPPDLAGAVAGPQPEPEAPGARATTVTRQSSAEADQAARRRSERDLAGARQAIAEAERRDERARAELEAIDTRLAELSALRERLTAELDELEARVAEVTRDAAATDHETRALRQARDRAGRAAAEAQRHLARALDALQPDVQRDRSATLGG